jgi:hypothetical protein
MNITSDNITLQLIVLIHTLFVLFVVVTPLSNSNYFLLLHLIIVPFVIIHWLLNNNMCALTLFEKALREKISGVKTAKKECFTCKIIEPIYDFKNNYKERAALIYAGTSFLLLITIYKLVKKYKDGKIKSIYDFMKI